MKLFIKVSPVEYPLCNALTLLEAITALVAQAMNVLLLVMVVMILMNVQRLSVGKICPIKCFPKKHNKTTINIILQKKTSIFNQCPIFEIFCNK